MATGIDLSDMMYTALSMLVETEQAITLSVEGGVLVRGIVNSVIQDLVKIEVMDTKGFDRYFVCKLNKINWFSYGGV